MPLEEDIRAIVRAAVTDAVAPLEREIRALRADVAHKPARWISRREAAEARGVSIDTIDRMIASGHLRSQKSGRAVRVLDEESSTDSEVARLAARAVSR